MIKMVGRLAPCFALAAVMATQAPAQAQPAAAPAPMGAMPMSPAPMADSEQARLARHIVRASFTNLHEMRPLLEFGMDKAEAAMKAGVAKTGAPGQIAYDRLGYWFRLFGDASWDELESDGPKFERILVPYMAKHFTVEELRAMADLLDDPAYGEIRAYMMAKAIQTDPNAKMSRPAQLALRRFNQSAGGMSLMAKAKDLPKDPDFEPVGLDLLAAWLPGAARRWGEKAEAAEAARAAAKAAGSAPN